MKTIVISAVNIRKGGTLTILQDCLSYLSKAYGEDSSFRIVALVHRKDLADYRGIEYIEIPWSIDNWMKRLWCEYVTMKKISKRLAPVYLWFSLHDTSPNVLAERRCVYYHNSFPFFKWKWKYLYYNYKIVLFSSLTKVIYRKNVQKNYKIVVQQNWIRNIFSKVFRYPKDDIIVSFPFNKNISRVIQTCPENIIHSFLFPSFCDVHKNFETLCQAAKLLEREVGSGQFKVYVTIKGNENKYTAYLKKNWGDVKSLEFIGFLSKEELMKYYQMVDCLVFPSRVETWGLPISEFIPQNKPMLLADLPYAHETAQGSSKTAFFDVDNPVQLKDYMKRLLNKDDSFLRKIEKQPVEAPVAYSWNELFDLLLQ